MSQYFAQASSGAVTGARPLLTAARTYYVRTDGNDANDGTANDAAHAFLTAQAAVNAASLWDFGNETPINKITIKFADGAYNNTCYISGFVGRGELAFVGNIVTPANVTITVAGDNCFFIEKSGTGVVVSYEGVKLSTSVSGSCLRMDDYSTVTFKNLNFGACADFHIYVNTNSFLQITGNYSVSGNAQIHFYTVQNGLISFNTSVNIAFSNNPVFSTSFAYIHLKSALDVGAGITYTNKATVTAKRYTVRWNSICSTATGAPDVFPGATLGTTDLGGQYS